MQPHRSSLSLGVAGPGSMLLHQQSLNGCHPGEFAVFHSTPRHIPQVPVAALRVAKASVNVPAVHGRRRARGVGDVSYAFELFLDVLFHASPRTGNVGGPLLPTSGVRVTRGREQSSAAWVHSSVEKHAVAGLHCRNSEKSVGYFHWALAEMLNADELSLSRRLKFVWLQSLVSLMPESIYLHSKATSWRSTRYL